MLFFSRTCREVTTILVAQEDRRLGLRDRLALRLHLSICKTCPRFERQILVMRQSFKRWRHYTEADNGADVNSASSNKN